MNEDGVRYAALQYVSTKVEECCVFTVELGQAWKRRGLGEAPHDSIALSFDGVNVLPQVAEESLSRVVAELVWAVSALVVDGERSGQVSLEESNLELCLWRSRGFEVELQVIDFGQPPRRVGPVQTVDLAELKDAVVRCARNFMRDAGTSVELDRNLRDIEATVLEELPTRHPEPFTFEHGSAQLRIGAGDLVGRLTSWSKKSRASLPALLLEGRIDSGASRIEGLVFLDLQRLARTAMAEGSVLIGNERVEPLTVFEAALEFVVALRRHHPALAHNPYLESLQVRCIDGVAALKEPVPDLAPGGPGLGLGGSQRAPPVQPLIKQGAARRVRLQAQWSTPVALGEEGAKVHLVKGGVIIASAHAAHAFSSAGKTKFRRLATRGVATSSHGSVVCADPNRVLLFGKRKGAASWLRDHDGAHFGPNLVESGNIGVTSMSNRGAVALDLLTGRELWRFDPTRTQKGYLTVHGPRVLLTTDGGSMFGLDTADGQVRFRIRAAAPAVGPAVMVGRRALFVMTQGDSSIVAMCEAMGTDGVPAGTLAWSTEVPLTHAAPPVASKQRTFIAGLADGKSQVLCLDQHGQLLWQRAVACDERTIRVVPFEGGVIASDARGVAVRLMPDGQIDWVLGANGDELSQPLAPQFARKLLVIPGPAIRVVEPSTGRVLSELDVGPHLTDYVLDSKFTLYTYTEPGTLQAFTPGTLLSVVV